MKTLQILHISDLHIDEKEDFDRSIVLDPLIERVEKDRKSGFQPEIVVVTGDVAFKGISAEYDLAKVFFDDLLRSLELSDERLFIVPGNHDVNRKTYRPTDIPAYDTMRDLSNELENVDFRADLLKGMNDYFIFIEADYPHMRSVDGRLVPFVNTFTARCGRRIGLIGLNSSWMCRKSPDEREIAVGEFQVKKAVERLGEEDVDIQLIIQHHPLNWLWPEDQKINRRYFNNSVLLCGHLHDVEGGYSSDLNGNLYQFQAGGAYLGSESGWPARFQYITFDWQENLIRLDFRKFVRGKRKWGIDGETGDDGKKFFDMVTSAKMVLEATSETRLEMPETYLKWIIDNYGHMDADKLYGKGDAFPLSLPEVFIPLKAYEPGARSEKIRGLEERREPIDIEDVIAISDCLLIEGQAGSGKTTLLKHLAYCLARKDSIGSQIKGMDDFLPVLIPLKDLNDFFLDRATGGNKGQIVLDILTWYFRSKMGSVLSIETVMAFLKAKKSAILLDGLDELLPQHRDSVVNAFSDLGIKHRENKIVLTSRPHGIEGAAIKRFGNKHIKILSLNMEQVNLFIQQWFAYLYRGSSGIGGKNALTMIGEIKAHSAISQLIDNPLMLTAICILYHDEKELPGQRAELYKKFIDNLLYRRFPDSERVHSFLKNLAFKMHEETVRTVDRTFATETLKRVYKKRDEESEEDYRERIEETFDDIEPKCGLLKLEGGQYNFWHLTFQEFLAARHIVDNSRDYAKAIAKYWGDDWYREVIELYIGYLSIENKRWANGIVEDVLNNKDDLPFKKWLLAAASLVDIHKDRREPDALNKARERLLSIIEASPEPEILVEAGETLGWLGDFRDLIAFVKIEGGEYELEDIGKEPLPSFEIGKYPVTNAWFEEFIKAGGYKNKDYWSKEGRKWLDHTKAEQPRLWNDRKWKCPNSPVVGVSWYEAYAFTRWLSLERKDGYEYRLLSEKEWQAVAGGLDGRKYPWGDKWDKRKCNNLEIKIEKTSPVGVFKEGNTPDGISDLSGNVWEWMLSDYDSRKELDDFAFDKEMQELVEKDKINEYLSKLKEKERHLPVLRGGSWFARGVICRCADRYWLSPYFRFSYVGFRCARTIKL